MASFKEGPRRYQKLSNLVIVAREKIAIAHPGDGETVASNWKEKEEAAIRAKEDVLEELFKYITSPIPRSKTFLQEVGRQICKVNNILEDHFTLKSPDDGRRRAVVEALSKSLLNSRPLYTVIAPISETLNSTKPDVAFDTFKAFNLAVAFSDMAQQWMTRLRDKARIFSNPRDDGVLVSLVEYVPTATERDRLTRKRMYDKADIDDVPEDGNILFDASSGSKRRKHIVKEARAIAGRDGHDGDGGRDAILVIDEDLESDVGIEL